MLYLYIVFSFLNNVLSQMECDAPSKCLTTSIIADTNICKYSDGQHIYVRNCGKQLACTKSYPGFNVTLCETSFEKGYAGDKCELDLECYSNMCKDNKCYHYPDGHECQSFYECSSNSICKAGVCKRLVEKGQPCTYDAECSFGTMCGTYVKGGEYVCIGKFTIPNGNYSPTPNLCESGKITSNYTCYDTRVWRDEPEYKRCISDEDCLYTRIINGQEDEKIQGTCECSYDGHARCQGSTTSQEWKSYIDVFKREAQHHTKINVHDIVFINDPNKYNLNIRRAYAKYKVEYQGVEDCVIDALIGSQLTSYKSIIPIISAIIVFILTIAITILINVFINKKVDSVNE